MKNRKRKKYTLEKNRKRKNKETEVTDVIFYN